MVLVQEFTMSAWRRTAIEKLPKYRQIIDHSKSVMDFLDEINYDFTQAHRDPIDEDIIRGVYDFAWRAVGESRNDDISNSVAIGFFEDLPQDKRVRELLPRFMTRDQFLGMVDIFKYHLSPEEHSEFVRDFLKRRESFMRFSQ